MSDRLELQLLNSVPWSLARCGARRLHRSLCSSIPCRILPYVAFNKDAFPTIQRNRAGCTKSFSLPKQAQVFLRKSSSAISGFRSLCGRAAQLQAIALNWTCVLEPFTRAGSRFENSGLTRNISTGPVTLDRRCDRNVVAPGRIFQEVFLLQSGFMGAFYGPRPPAEYRPDRLWGACPHVNPAAVIKASISPLWPCPASTTRDGAGRQKTAACGISAR